MKGVVKQVPPPTLCRGFSGFCTTFGSVCATGSASALVTRANVVACTGGASSTRPGDVLTRPVVQKPWAHRHKVGGGVGSQRIETSS